MRKIQATVVFLVVSVAGYAAANYFIQTDSVRPCNNWTKINLEYGGFGYVCSSNPFFKTKIPNANDTIQAISDLNFRLKKLEHQVNSLQGNPVVEE